MRDWLREFGGPKVFEDDVGNHRGAQHRARAAEAGSATLVTTASGCWPLVDLRRNVSVLETSILRAAGAPRCRRRSVNARPNPRNNTGGRPMKKLLHGAIALAFAAPLALSAQMSDPDKKVTDGGIKAAGWEARLDKADAKVADLKFATMGSGFHVTSGPAAIYWHPDHAAKGNYTVKASLTQTKAPMHREAYGIFVGGDDLKDASQSYLYMVIAGTGEYLIKHRAGNEVHTVKDWTKHDAVKVADAAGKATNEVAIEVGASEVRFLVNGTEVYKAPRSGMLASLDGMVGLRVNHNLDVHVGTFSVTKM
jgi:hypothetical protein